MPQNPPKRPGDSSPTNRPGPLEVRSPRPRRRLNESRHDINERSGQIASSSRDRFINREQQSRPPLSGHPATPTGLRLPQTRSLARLPPLTTGFRDPNIGSSWGKGKLEGHFTDHGHEFQTDGVHDVEAYKLRAHSFFRQAVGGPILEKNGTKIGENDHKVYRLDERDGTFGVL